MIYFDNAATTFPKPESVYREVRRCMEEYCGNPGRSGHSMSAAAEKTVYECRGELAQAYGGQNIENVVFTMNTTYALNMAIKSILRQSDHVLISNIEHNSVLRPIIASGCDYDVFDSCGAAEKVIGDIRNKLTPRTRLLVCTHQSNICPIRNPIKSIGEFCRHNGIYFIVDAAQSAGVYPINIREYGIDALCLAGHKGLYGIQGCGAVIFSERFKGERARKLSTFAEGGNGVDSLDGHMPALLPERLEAGTLPTPAIAGLLEGIRTVKSLGINHIREHEQTLYRRLRERLCNDDGIEVYCPHMNYGQTLLFNVKGVPSVRVADYLDGNGICVRAGFHCSPLGHKLLGTGSDGAVRVSFGAFNTLEEVDRFSNILNEMVKQNTPK